VNLMPVVPGHVLLIPKRKVLRFLDLTKDEVSDLFISVQKVSAAVEQQFNATSLTLAVQDGKDAGQTVEHVHVHIMPRKKGDFEQNDEIYSAIEKERRKRTEDEMAQEAALLDKYFPDNHNYSLVE